MFSVSSVFKRHNGDVSRRKLRLDTKFEEECRRLINVVENLTEQRKESVEIIQLVNKGLTDLISNLQKKNPQHENVKPIPEELLNTVSSQLLNTIQAQLGGELLDDESDFDDHNDDDGESSERIKRNDDGLKTELVILQSQLNRLRTEQDKIVTKLDQKSPSSNGESSSHAYKRKSSAGLIDSFNLSKESLTDSDFSGTNNSGKDSDAELIKKQEKEIHKLRQKVKFYEDQLNEYTSMNGTMNENHHVNVTTNELKDDFKKLQRSFHTFTSVSSDEMIINKDASDELLESYQLGTFQENSKPSKVRLAAAIEAKISSLLNEKVEGHFALAMKDTYLEEDYDDDNLELDLVTTTEKLVELLDRFADVRADGDKKTSTKLRSLIYSSLSTSSFSTSENNTHPFISSLVSDILKSMEEYRTLPAAELKQAKKEAEQIILEFISLVYFKLRSLDPRPRLFYYDQGTNVDEHKMKGAWDKTDASNQEVEVCYFPAVIINQKTNSTISKAQVLTRRRYKSSPL
jgi:hypothetical protein